MLLNIYLHEYTAGLRVLHTNMAIVRNFKATYNMINLT